MTQENPDRDHKGAVNSIDIHPSDPLCVSGSGDRSVRVWNFEHDTSQELRLRTILSPNDEYKTV